jgi:hypothetical protein
VRKSVFRDRISLSPGLSKQISFKVPNEVFRRAKEAAKEKGYPSLQMYVRGRIEEEMLRHRREAKDKGGVEYG